MKYSIKPPSGLLWKTGYTMDQVVSRREDGGVKDDWLICPLGEASLAITVEEFLDNPSVFVKEGEGGNDFVPSSVEEDSLSMASLGWAVFFGSLFVYLIVSLMAAEMAKEIVVSGGKVIFPATLTAMVLKGLDALIIAGAITALLGHGYERIKKSEK